MRRYAHTHDACGRAQVFARSSKFSLFDPAKEMVYIEMPAEEKRQGKAAVDLVGSQARGRAYVLRSLLFFSRVVIWGATVER